MRKMMLTIISMFMLISIFSFKSHSTNPGNLDAVLQEAKQLGKEERYVEAIAKAEQVLAQEEYSQNKHVHLFLGLMYFRTQQYDESLNHFTTVTAVDPHSAMSYYFLGLIYEAKALQEPSDRQVRDMKRKALDAWNMYLTYTKTESTNLKEKPHCNIGMTREECLEHAQKHIDTLTEELRK